MIAQHLSRLLSKHHLHATPTFHKLIQSLMEELELGSSCCDVSQLDIPLDEALATLACDQPGSVVGSLNSHTPLILTDQHLLYLQRYALYEDEISSTIKALLDDTSSPTVPDLEPQLTELFGTIEDNDQATAARRAILHNFSIISGGPGTGKTTTVLNILKLLQQNDVFQHADDVLLIAPTGKAADRLRQSIIAGIERSRFDSTNFPTNTSTIHRALGFKHSSIEFKHGVDFPLSAKVVIVDETSMVDMTLMAKLLRAIQAGTKVILLGDKHQLASVAVGSVLGDLIAVSENTDSALHPVVTTLRKSYRTQGAIQQACQAVKDGDADAAWKIATQSSDATDDTDGAIHIASLPTQLTNALRSLVKTHWLPHLKNNQLSHEEKLQAIDAFRILCPTHAGPFGIESINAAVESILKSEGIDTSEHWYEGRSIIVQKNDNAIGIFNGDTGLTLRENNETVICFNAAEGVRLITPALLPEVKTAWALTIHRTQGSEYNHILLILPPAKEGSKILSRELLYTGLSRAKKSATIWSDEASLTAAIDTTVQRASGLSAMFS